MRKEYKNKIPDPGERFSYVIIQSDQIFDLTGNKLKLRKSDQIEFVDVAKELSRSIDLSLYFENTIIGLCTRFIMYNKKYEPPSTDKIMEIVDSDEKYKQVDTYAQNKVKKWLETYIKEINVINEITLQMISTHGYAYKRAIEKGKKMLFEKIENIYEALQGNCINYKYFIYGNSISKIWENLVKYIEIKKKRKLKIKKGIHIEILIEPDIINSICYNLTEHISSIAEIAIKYNLFFHQLVYHMRYKEHITIPDKIGTFKIMRKNEIIIEQPTLPYISKAEQILLKNFQKT